MDIEVLKEILRANRTCSRPEYYSGRGATLTDLDSEILLGIQQGIIDKFGEKAGKSYVKMVADIEELSATTFLNELYNLFHNDWKYRKVKVAPGSDLIPPKDENGEYNMEAGMFGMMQRLFGNPGNDTHRITWKFLLANGIQPRHPRSPDGRYYRFH